MVILLTNNSEFVCNAVIYFGIVVVDFEWNLFLKIGPISLVVWYDGRKPKLLYTYIDDGVKERRLKVKAMTSNTSSPGFAWNGMNTKYVWCCVSCLFDDTPRLRRVVHFLSTLSLEARLSSYSFFPNRQAVNFSTSKYCFRAFSVYRI